MKIKIVAIRSFLVGTTPKCSRFFQWQ